MNTGIRRSDIPGARRLATVRKDGSVPYLRPDGKTQVTIEYDKHRPARLDTIVVSSQHAADIDIDTLLAPDITEHVVAVVGHDRLERVPGHDVLAADHERDLEAL